MFFESFIINAFIANALIIALTFDYITKFFSYWYVRNVPYKRPIPIFGSDFERICCFKSTTDVVNKLYSRYPESKLVGYIKGRLPDVIVRDPFIVQEVLENSFEYFKNRGTGVGVSKDALLSENTFFSEGSKWEEFRCRAEKYAKNYNESLNLIKIGEILPEESQNANITEYGLKYASKCIFSGDLHAYNAIEELKENNFTNKLRNYFMVLFPSLHTLFGINVASKMVKTNIKQCVMNSKIDSKDNFHESFILHLLKEGLIPCANAISTILHEIAENQALESALHDEIMKGKELNLENKSNFPLLEATVLECLRLFPHMSVLQRVCVQPYKLTKCDIYLDKGVTVNIPIDALHRDEKYFENAEVFYPWRFIDDMRGLKHRGHYTFLPFGAGPRKCPGEKMATLIMMSGVYAIVKDFTVRRTKSGIKMVDNGFSRTLANDVILELTPRKK